MGGDAVQHLQYMPFGEHFVNQTSTSWQTRYTFSGKEKDAETEYSYFGARYYDSDLSVWLSVDPMSDKYPNQSAYSYVGGRPINVIDPNGMLEDSWEINIETGETTRTSGFGGDVFQIISVVDNSGNVLGTSHHNGSASDVQMDYSASSSTSPNSSSSSYNLSLSSENVQASYSLDQVNTTAATQNSNLSSYNIDGIIGTSVQMFSGLAEAAIGAGSEFLSGGTSSPLSIPLIIDGAARVGLNGAILFDLLLYPEQTSNLPSNLGGMFGQAIDYSISGSLNYGAFQAAGSITNDFGMFIYSGGTMGAMFTAQKSPSLFNITNAATTPIIYTHSLFYDCKPLIKQ